MKLPLQTFSSLVQNAAAFVQGAASGLLDLSVGSVLRAVLEANASIGLWLQWLLLLVLNNTRAATSQGPDLDSWMADFALTRLPAVAAMGTVTFSRFSPINSALIPVGALVKTGDGTQSFAVIASPNNPLFSPTQSGYVLGAGVASGLVPVVATTPGSAGNVQAGTVTLLASAIPGVDSVTNSAAFTGGADAESDAAFRARFVAYINSRTQATKAAIGYAISSLQQGLSYTIAENVDTAGNPRAGNFVVTVTNGQANLPESLLAEVSAAIDAVRPVGTSFAVQTPQQIVANVSLSLTLIANTNSAQVSAQVSNSISSYIGGLGIGQALPIARIAQLALDASPFILNVSNISINGQSVDLNPGATGIVVAGNITIN
ncbi:MAG: baseplate J/gp47 family protein [Acidobacteriia bacterium]|nr:baseplate J/gp47 family protein [Methyloceanibacter sp.]MCL6492215.1 baseplate J/gp47 family protein [Terriglobia bacterium]